MYSKFSWSPDCGRQWVLALALGVAAGGRADAQISLLPGPQRIISSAPKFIAAADFNHDRVADVAVVDSSGNTVTVLLGATDSSAFGSMTTFNIGRTLRGLRTGDFNNDGIPDLAVADLIDDKVFVATGVGNGAFDVRAPDTVGLNPFDIAVGNLDRQNGDDLLICSPGTHSLGVYLNQGFDRGFALGQVLAGGSPTRCAAADLNGDGLDDIITLNTGAGALDYISVLLNNGDGAFVSPAMSFEVGAGAADLAIADFNDDGVPDIAVLNAGRATEGTSFTVSILINQTSAAAGKRSGTGAFIAVTPVTLNCPTAINGLPISCRPNFLTAGDLDSDALVDLAITVFTRPRDTISSIQTSGLVVAFNGHGDGTFDFSTQVTVGYNPQGIVAGDFNGDGTTDLAIAEPASLSVRILTASTPPPHNGTCHVDRQCVSGHCADGVCCATACPAGQFCDIPGMEGICAEPASIPHACTDGHQCSTGFCVGGFCCTNPTCGTGLFCNTPEAVCRPPATNGTPCNSHNAAGGDDQCASGHCTDGVCCQRDACLPDETCNLPGSEGTCVSLPPQGSACAADGQCATRFCTEGICCGVRACPAGQSCAIPGFEGFCAPLPATTPAPTAAPTASPTIGVSTRRSCERDACPPGLVCVTDPGFEAKVCDCVGDCDDDYVVTVDEVVQMANAALGVAAGACPLGDADGDGAITVDEMIVATNSLLSSCPTP